MANQWLRSLNVKGWWPRSPLSQLPLVKHAQQQLQSALKALPLPPVVVDLGRPVILTSVIVTAVLLGVRHLGGLEKFELAAYDHLVGLRPLAKPDDRLLIVGITEEDIQSRREWPLSDRTVAQLLTKLQAHHPKVISLDIMRDVPLEPGRQELLQRLTQSKNIIAVCKASNRNYLGVPPPPGMSAEQVGFSDLIIDSGGTLRRALLWMDPPAPTGGLINQTGHLCSGQSSGQTDDKSDDKSNGQGHDKSNGQTQKPRTILSFSLQTALFYLTSQGIQPKLTDAGDLQLGAAVLKRLPPNFSGYQTVDTSGYQVMLNYRAAQNLAPQVSLQAVLNDQVDPALIRDRIVFIGYVTPQAGDDFYTPYSQAQRDDQKMPGVTIHAQSTSQMLSAVFDQRPLIWAWPDAIAGLWIWLWSLSGGLLAWHIRQPWRLSLAGLGAAGTLYVICFGAMLQGGWLPLVPAVLALGATASSTISALNQKLKTENIRIKAELDITRRLQQMILPPASELSAIQELDIAGYMDPCDEVGGDYYDVLSHNGHLKIGIGDVTGHGLESGLIMIMVQTAVRTLLESNEQDAPKFLNLLNRTIYQNVQRINCDKTMTLSLLDYHAGTLLLSGQHEEVLIVRANGDLEKFDTVNLGFPIALEEDIEDFVSQTKIQLSPGDLVVLYTDGITEAMNTAREQYGLARLCDVVVKHHDRSAQAIKQSVIQDVRNYIGQQTVFDDITLLVIKQK